MSIQGIIGNNTVRKRSFASIPYITKNISKSSHIAITLLALSNIITAVTAGPIAGNIGYWSAKGLSFLGLSIASTIGGIFLAKRFSGQASLVTLSVIGGIMVAFFVETEMNKPYIEETAMTVRDFFTTISWLPWYHPLPGLSSCFTALYACMSLNLELRADLIRKSTEVGFGAQDNLLDYKTIQNKIQGAVKKHFKPEFLNRLDNCVIFRTLDKKALKDVVDLEFKKFQDRLNKKGISISLDDKAKAFLVDRVWRPTERKRTLRISINFDGWFLVAWSIAPYENVKNRSLVKLNMNALLSLKLHLKNI